ncbi:UNVERIFIED_CONTAM: hypothetical protein FKN15_057805 [Acipenser sinensis]
MMHESFPFVQRCRQENPYFQSWVLNHAEVSPDFPIQPPYSAEFEVPGAAQDHSQLEALSGRLGKRRGAERSPPGIAGERKEAERQDGLASAGLGSGTQPVTREGDLEPTFHMDSDRIHRDKHALHRLGIQARLHVCAMRYTGT